MLLRSATVPRVAGSQRVAASTQGRRARKPPSLRVCAAAAQPAFVSSGFFAAEAPEGASGERVRVEVGPVGERKQQTFLFAPVLPLSSLVVVTLPRPLGVVFVPDRDGRVRVASLVPGSHAGRAAAVGKLAPGGAQAASEGDVLRAVTATVFSFTARAQTLGDLTGTKRTVVLFGADGESYDKCFAALGQGLCADGPVTLVLERAQAGSQGARWSPLPVAQNAEEPVRQERGESDSEAQRRQRREETLRLEGPGPAVGAALATTLGLLALLLAAGFFP